MPSFSDRPIILVYTPYFRGFYLGEVSVSLFKNSQAKNFNIIHIRTGGTNDFSLPLALDKVDGVIVVLNAISTELVEKILEKNIPIVSIGHDYFPQQVEYVGCNNQLGIQLVFDHLYRQGCRKIGFSGDLSIYDMRGRYDAYVEILKQNSIPYDENRVFNVNNFEFQGGINTARMFKERKSDCEAIIFAADKMAIGFSSFCKQLGIRIPKDLLITGYDNCELGSFVDTRLTTIDQNVIGMASFAVDRLLQRINGDSFYDHPKLIDPILIARQSTGADKQSLDQTAKYSLNFYQSKPLRSLTIAGEDPMGMAAYGLPSLQSYSNIHGPFMNWAMIAKTQEDYTEHSKKTLKVIEVVDGNPVSSKGTDALLSVEEFPLSHIENPHKESFLINLLPVYTADNTVKILSTKSEKTILKQPELLIQFNCFLEVMSTYIKSDTFAEANLPFISHAPVETHEQDFNWSWDITNNKVTWGATILDMLGYSSQVEKEAYGKMAFFERIHPDDAHYVRTLIKSHIDTGREFNTKFRLKTRDHAYIWVKVYGNGINDESGKLIQLMGKMTSVPKNEQPQTTDQVYLSQLDYLTGLPGRRYFLDHVKEQIRKYPKRKLAIMWLDLNRFKQINDNYGYETGDYLLKHVADTIRSKLKGRHIFTRFGNDEFVIAAQVRTNEHAEALCKRVMDAIEEPYTLPNKHYISISGSAGISIYPDSTTNPEKLLKHADLAASKAKHQKLKKPLVYSSEITRSFKNRAPIENNLRNAIESDELYLLFQPQIDINTNKLLGVEALCRWKSDQLGQIAPLDFITVAEETGMIHVLGDWVLDTSLSALKQWNNAGLNDIKLSINISLSQLMDPNLIRRYRDKINAFNLDYQSVAIEITEAAAIDDLQKSTELLKGFADLGIQISLDDFGTGVSSISLLRDLPLNWVKIDKSFIENIENSAKDQSIVRSICTLGHSLDYKVVAEGIETQRQLAIAKSLGCDIVQGFLFSKPLSVGEIEYNYLNLNNSNQKQFN